LAVKYNIINKAGTWYSYGEERIGQGRENVRKYLTENPTICKEIEMKIKKEAGLLDASVENSADTPKQTSKADDVKEVSSTKGDDVKEVSQAESGDGEK
ncbi:MAG: DNA recombination/repair protein RecA, partial [Leptospirales bacterium]|nr:DNA recombination/repair protein RecA [Leptospirales bacterium]